MRSSTRLELRANHYEKNWLTNWPWSGDDNMVDLNMTHYLCGILRHYTHAPVSYTSALCEHKIRSSCFEL